MSIDGLEKVTLGDLREIHKYGRLSLKEAIPLMWVFRDEHGLTDREALNASKIAQRIFETG